MCHCVPGLSLTPFNVALVLNLRYGHPRMKGINNSSTKYPLPQINSLT